MNKNLSEKCHIAQITRKNFHFAPAMHLEEICQKEFTSGYEAGYAEAMKNSPDADDISKAIEVINALSVFAANHGCFTTPVNGLINAMKWLEKIKEDKISNPSVEINGHFSDEIVAEIKSSHNRILNNAMEAIKKISQVQVDIAERLNREKVLIVP